MPIGFQSFTDSGSLQIDADKYTYQFVAKGTAIGTLQSGTFGGAYWTAIIDFNENILPDPSYDLNNPILFVAPGCWVGPANNLANSVFRFTLISSESEFIPWALFDVGQVSSNNFGMRLYKDTSAGVNIYGSNVTFDSNLKPLLIAQGGVENLHFNTSTNLPFTGQTGRLYYVNGGGTLKVESLGEEDPFDPFSYLVYNYQAIMNRSGNVLNFGFHTLEVGSTNNPSELQTTSSKIPWLIADVTNIVDYVLITNRDISFSRQTSSPVTTTYTIRNNGFVERTHLTTTKLEDWIRPTSFAPGLYEVRATSLVGTNSGTFGTWLPLTSDRSWSNTQTGTGTKNGTIFIEIREMPSTRIVTSATITMNATKTNPPA
jgi:hypothetical protein